MCVTSCVILLNRGGGNRTQYRGQLESLFCAGGARSIYWSFLLGSLVVTESMRPRDFGRGRRLVGGGGREEEEKGRRRMREEDEKGDHERNTSSDARPTQWTVNRTTKELRCHHVALISVHMLTESERQSLVKPPLQKHIFCFNTG